MIAWIILILTTIFAWYPVLSFWFFQAWEQSWLIGNCGYHFNLPCIIQGHALLYLINYMLFGWNPTGWYATALLLHIIAVLLVLLFVSKLTGNKIIAFVASLIFAVNITYHDVLTWGSFNGLYALMLCTFIGASLCYRKFKEIKDSRRFLWYGGILLLFSIGLLVRESALLLPLLLVSLEVFDDKFVFSKKKIGKTLLTFLPIFLLLALYLLWKNFYGAASYDYVDSSVQYRISLLSQGQYVEYIKRTILMVGLFAGPHIIPFPLLNFLRDHATAHFTSPFINYYFFPSIGLSYILLQILLIRKNWTNKKIRNVLLIAFIWFLLPGILACLVITYSDETMVRPYNFNVPPRYRYFAFFGTTLFWTIIFWQLYNRLATVYKKNKKIIAYAFVFLFVGNMILNLILLRGIQEEMFTTLYKPEKDFYKQFTTQYKKLPKDYLFYVYPSSGPLKDFLAEWHHIRRVYYPYLTKERGATWEENHVGMLLQRLSEGNGRLDETFFVDYTPKLGLIDKTDKGRKILSTLTNFTYNVQGNISTDTAESGNKSYTLDLLPKLHVEIPYDIIVSLTANPDTVTQQSSYSAQKLQAIGAYTKDRIEFQKNTKISVSATAPMGGVEGRPAMFLTAKNLIDGNFGRKSLWVGNSRPAWILLDLGQRKTIGALAFHTMSPADIPSTYTIEVSEDGKQWKEVTRVRGNASKQQVVVFNPVEGQYVKFTVLETAQGTFASFDELEVLSREGSRVAQYYRDNFEQLLLDSNLYGGSAFLKLSWTTNLNTSTDPSGNSIYVPVILDGANHDYIFSPNENEHFSLDNELFIRTIDSLSVSIVGLPTQASLSQIKIVPRFSLSVSESGRNR